MAIIHGSSGSEKELLKGLPDIDRLTDIDNSLKRLREELELEREEFLQEFKDMKEELRKRRRSFLRKVPRRIRKLQREIEEIDDDNILVRIWNLRKKVRKLREKRKLEEDPERLFEKVEKDLIGEVEYIEEDPEKAFEEEQEQLIEEIGRLSKVKTSPTRYGAEGEIKVLEELKKLNNSFHIFCDLNIELERYQKFRGKYDLKSAQIDFTVVGPKGIFVVEVKNWSSEFIEDYDGLSPHEQVTRATRVLFNFLKDEIDMDLSIKRRLTSILVPVRNNLQYDRRYKTAMVKNIDELNRFIENRNNSLTRDEVKEVVRVLEEVQVAR